MIDFSALVQTVQEAVALGLGEGAEIVARGARQKAPVRRIFSNRGPVIGTKTASEIEESRDIRASLGLSVEGSRDNPSPRIVRSRIPPRRWMDRRLSQANQLLADRDAVMARRLSGFGKAGSPRRLQQFHANQKAWRTALSARGAYEVRTRRAVGRFGGHRTIGGTLRASITAEPVTRSGGKSVAWVIASAEYAKYMEFGTVHAAAHPFLRPAAEESRQKVAAIVGDQVRAAISQARLGKFEIEIVIPIGVQV